MTEKERRSTSIICIAWAKRGRIRPITILYLGFNLVAVTASIFMMGGIGGSQ